MENSNLCKISGAGTGREICQLSWTPSCHSQKGIYSANARQLLCILSIQL